MRIGLVDSFNKLSGLVHENAKSKGFYESAPSFAEQIALMHSELSEALEGYRHHNPPSEHIPEFTAIEEELADVIIRIMDATAYRKLRIAEAIMAKIKFNSSREYKHGGKKL